MDAVGMDGNNLNVVLMQLVRLVRDGEIVRMSKRSGKAIQLSDLLDEVPVDAARFFFNQREANTQIEFDLGLAIEQSSSNPVYYVQYAHARLCSIFRTLAEDGVSLTDALSMMGIVLKYGREDPSGLCIAAGSDLALPWNVSWAKKPSQMKDQSGN